jgi:hypothetical protein
LNLNVNFEHSRKLLLPHRHNALQILPQDALEAICLLSLHVEAIPANQSKSGFSAWQNAHGQLSQPQGEEEAHVGVMSDACCCKPHITLPTVSISNILILLPFLNDEMPMTTRAPS